MSRCCSLPFAFVLKPLLRAVGSRAFTPVALGHLRLALFLAAFCLGVVALAHFLVKTIIFFGSSPYSGARAGLRPVRGTERRFFWTHLRGQCASHIFVTDNNVFATSAKQEVDAMDASLATPSPAQQEAFRRRLWAPCKTFLAATLPFEGLLRADVSHVREQKRQERERKAPGAKATGAAHHEASRRFIIPFLLLQSCCSFAATCAPFPSAAPPQPRVPVPRRKHDEWNEAPMPPPAPSPEDWRGARAHAAPGRDDEAPTVASMPFAPAPVADDFDYGGPSATKNAPIPGRRRTTGLTPRGLRQKPRLW